MLYEFFATYAIQPSFKNICKKLLYLEKKNIGYIYLKYYYEDFFVITMILF